MSYLGEETEVVDEKDSKKEPKKKGSMIPIFGEAAGSFLNALGFGKKPDDNGKTDWTPIIITGGAIVGGLILMTAVMRKPKRRRRR